MFNTVQRRLGLLASLFPGQLGIDTGHAHTPPGKLPLNFSRRRMKSLSLTAIESRNLLRSRFGFVSQALSLTYMTSRQVAIQKSQYFIHHQAFGVVCLP